MMKNWKGGLKDERNIRGFQCAVNNLDLMDCGYKGQMYTWWNKRERWDMVNEGLERALCCIERRQKFPDSSLSMRRQ